MWAVSFPGNWVFSVLLVTNCYWFRVNFFLPIFSAIYYSLFSLFIAGYEQKAEKNTSLRIVCYFTIAFCLFLGFFSIFFLRFFIRTSKLFHMLQLGNFPYVALPYLPYFTYIYCNILFSIHSGRYWIDFNTVLLFSSLLYLILMWIFIIIFCILCVLCPMWTTVYCLPRKCVPFVYLIGFISQCFIFLFLCANFFLLISQPSSVLILQIYFVFNCFMLFIYWYSISIINVGILLFERWYSRFSYSLSFFFSFAFSLHRVMMGIIISLITVFWLITLIQMCVFIWLFIFSPFVEGICDR